MKKIKQRNFVRDILFGVSVGDALGVPVEFMSRESLTQNPVKDMREYGSYFQPKGTWSDDSTLTFCLAEALTEEFQLQNIANKFIDWLYNNHWTPHGIVFDAGISTRQALSKLKSGIKPELAGGTHESDNGNGSLMRILPLLFYIKDKPVLERFEIIKQVSSITHAHIRSVIACFYYLEFARKIFNGEEKFQAYRNLQFEINSHINFFSVPETEINLFDRLLNKNIFEFPERDIKSSGYVLHTLEASCWCLLTTETYEEAVLKAVNLGGDTDTTAAITGGLAGLLYGSDTIPKNWIKHIARRKDIELLSNQLNEKYFESQD